MAQPALTKNPLGITPFWQKASAEPPVEWDKWNQQLFLGIIAKDGMNLNKLLRNPPAIRKPQEPGYELNIEGETDKQIRDRNLRNQEKRVAWENQCQHLDNLGRRHTMGGSRYQMQKLHILVFGDGGPKTTNTILSKS